MSAPTNASTLENVGDVLAAGIKFVIEQDGARSPLPPFGPRDISQMPPARVEIRCGSFSRGSDQMNYAPDGSPYYNHRRGIASLTVITQRNADPNVGPDTKHGIAVGRCRWLMSRTAQKLIPSIVTYQIVDVIDLGDTYRADEPTETDRTEIRFQIDLVIPPANYTDT